MYPLFLIQLGGVVIPHDGQCYLQKHNRTFRYTMAETLVSETTYK